MWKTGFNGVGTITCQRHAYSPSQLSLKFNLSLSIFFIINPKVRTIHQ